VTPYRTPSPPPVRRAPWWFAFACAVHAYIPFVRPLRRHRWYRRATGGHWEYHWHGALGWGAWSQRRECTRNLDLGPTEAREQLGVLLPPVRCEDYPSVTP